MLLYLLSTIFSKKGPCSPGSATCEENQLFYCSQSGKWIGVNCKAGTKCGLSENAIACVRDEDADMQSDPGGKETEDEKKDDDTENNRIDGEKTTIPEKSSKDNQENVDKNVIYEKPSRENKGDDVKNHEDNELKEKDRDDKKGKSANNEEKKEKPKPIDKENFLKNKGADDASDKTNTKEKSNDNDQIKSEMKDHDDDSSSTEYIYVTKIPKPKVQTAESLPKHNCSSKVTVYKTVTKSVMPEEVNLEVDDDKKDAPPDDPNKINSPKHASPAQIKEFIKSHAEKSQAQNGSAKPSAEKSKNGGSKSTGDKNDASSSSSNSKGSSVSKGAAPSGSKSSSSNSKGSSVSKGAAPEGSKPSSSSTKSGTASSGSKTGGSSSAKTAKSSTDKSSKDKPKPSSATSGAKSGDTKKPTAKKTAPTGGKTGGPSSVDKPEDGDSAGSSSKLTGETTGKESGSKPTTSGQGGGGATVTPDQLKEAIAASGVGKTLPEGALNSILDSVNETMESNEEAAMFVAQCIHESAGFGTTEEIACTDNPGSCSQNYWDNAGVEGKSYHGRGYIQLSWPANYKAAGEALGLGDDLLNDPEIVAKNPKIAIATAIWFWVERVRPTGAVEKNQFGLSTKAINGPLECGGGSPLPAKRYEIYKKVAEAFGVTNIASDEGC